MVASTSVTLLASSHCKFSSMFSSPSSSSSLSSSSSPSSSPSSPSASSSSSICESPILPIHSWLRSPGHSHKMGSFHDVIRRCNKFDETEAGAMWEFSILNNSVPVGYMLPEHVHAMRWEGTGFRVSKKDRKVHLNPKLRPGDDVVEVCGREIVALCEKNADNVNGCFKKWLKTKSDFHVIRGLDAKLTGLVIPAPARGIFGIVTTGVHMNMFTVKDGQMQVWVSKRSQNVTYAGKLDQVVAGAMDPKDEMNPMITLGREAMEEAGLRVDAETGVVTRDGRRVGRVTAGTQISFYDQKDGVAGSEEGHVEPGIRYTFDLEVEPGFVPHPQEPESIDRFMLKSVEEVKTGLQRAEWKPNCGLVMLDFLLRKGEIKPCDDENYGLLRSGLQRKLPFLN